MYKRIEENKITAIIIALVVLLGIFIVTKDDDLQRYFACKKLAVNDAKEDNLDRSFQINSFYSKKINTCVETRIMDDKVGQFSYLIRDIGHGFIKEDNLILLQLRAQTDVGKAYSETIENLFFCNDEGVDNTVLSKVIAHKGRIWDLPYKDFVDDFAGGPSRAEKTPDHEFTKDECAKLFKQKITELK